MHVVGAGALGLGAALAFARAGWRVRVSDRDEGAPPRGSSAGRSRVLRCAHGPGGERYAELAWRARERWHALGHDLFAPVGVVWLLAPGDPFLDSSRAVLAELGIPHAVTDPEPLVPGLRAAGLGAALHEPQAGFLRSDRCLRALRIAAGVTVEREEVLPDDGPAAADVVVWACGPWLGRLFPGLAPVTAVRRGWLHLDAAPQIPVVCEPGARTYLVPDAGDGLKIGPEHDHVQFDPDSPGRTATVDDGIERAARTWLGGRLPALARRPAAGATLCSYELTPDAHFLLAERPDSGGGEWLLGGGSGHGFKHAPVLGELLVAAVEGRAAPDPAWGLNERAPLATPGSAMDLR